MVTVSTATCNAGTKKNSLYDLDSTTPANWSLIILHSLDYTVSISIFDNNNIHEVTKLPWIKLNLLYFCAFGWYNASNWICIRHSQTTQISKTTEVINHGKHLMLVDKHMQCTSSSYGYVARSSTSNFTRFIIQTSSSIYFKKWKECLLAYAAFKTNSFPV